MLNLLKPFWLSITKWAAIIGSFLLVLLAARKSGEQTIKQQNIELTLKGVQERDKVEDSVARSNNDERQRLRRKWTR